MTNESIQDYYTIVTSNGETKLNINNYVGTDILGEEQTSQNIDVKVVSRDIYMDYVTYNITVKNSTSSTIMLDSKEKTNSMYITDSSDVQYTAYAYGLTNNELILKSGYQTTLKIKYSKSYKAANSDKSLVFSDVILNYDDYMNAANKSDYKDRGKIEINL